MKLKIFFLSVLGLCCSGVALGQLQTIFQDSFESYEDFAIGDVGQWTLRDMDQLTNYKIDGVDFPNQGLPAAFIVFNPYETTPILAGLNWDAHTGAKSMVAFAAASSNPNVVPVNDDWLISPKITLLKSANELRFWAKSSTLEYGSDRFKVGVSTTDTEVTSFQIISPGNYMETTADWVEYTFDLSPFAEQDVYIAINCVSSDAFAFFVDDFVVVGSENASVNKMLASQFTVYPNPTSDIVYFSNSTHILVSKVEVKDLNGRTVKTLDLGAVSESSINLSNLQAGVYFLNFTTNEGSFTKKIIKN